MANSFGGGGAAAFITEKLDGIYTKVKIKNFNTWDATELREKFDVLHFAYQSPRTIQASWTTKLLAFMNAVPVPCGGMDEPLCIGGGILFEDPANVEDIVDLMLTDVQLHVPGDDPTIVVFSGPPALSVFAANLNGNNTGSFKDGEVSASGKCADNPPDFTGPTRGLGYGCLVNNHITFDNVQPLGLTPFLHLESDATAAVGLYGEFPDVPPVGHLPGRILFKGTDNGFHAGGGGVEFQANHFCLLTNEIIWVSQAVDITPENLVSKTVNECLANVDEFIAAVGD